MTKINDTKLIEIGNNKFHITDRKNGTNALYTTCLNNEIAFSFFVESSNRGGMGRNLDYDQTKKMLKELMPTNKKRCSSVLCGWRRSI
ncbi:MAG: hypothetical protein DGJ47_000638 [Rickettsiaceae bacterium]